MSWNQMDPKQILLEKIKQKGGWVNAHTHIDRSFIINEDNYHKAGDFLMLKWDYPDEFKKVATVEMIVNHMSQVVDNQLAQGVQALGSFIDCDSVVENKNLEAAEIVKQKYKGQLDLVFIHQPIKGLMDPVEREWFEKAAEYVDIIGGLPERDSEARIGVDKRAEHLDILFTTAQKYNKPLHVHVDQLNIPEQKDTELLLDKIEQYNYQGKVAAVHCISVAAQEKSYREMIYKRLADNDVTVIACPTAWIDSPRSEQKMVRHNSVTPIDEMIPAGVRIALGTDDIADIYKPYSDGDMWIELRTLLDANRYYELDKLVDVATINGRKALFLK